MKNEDGAASMGSRNDTTVSIVSNRIQFRPEAAMRYRTQDYGSASMAVSFPFFWYTFSALIMIAMIIGFMALGSFTTTEKSEAIIQTKSGVLDIRGEEEGVIAKLHVREGQRVRAGDPLVDLRRIDSKGEGAEAAPAQAGSNDDSDEAVASESRLESSEIAEVSEESAEAKTRSSEQEEVADNYSEMPNANDDLVRTVKSPIDAIVYQLPLQVGNSFNSFSNVVRVAGEGDLIVITSVSSEAHALLGMGDRVEIRMKAFKGTPKARLIGHISSIAMTPSEHWDQTTRTTSLKYKIEVQIDRSSSESPFDKLLGREVEIKVIRQKRKIYAWLFDPLKTLFGRD